MAMKNIADEIREFLRLTGLRQVVLARESGVSAATISRIVKEKQMDMLESKAQNIRAAMRSLTATPTTPREAEGGGDAA